MQVILRENVEHLGRRGDVVKVADGFARNYLIPKNLGYKLTEGVRRQIEIEKRAKESREARDRSNAEAVLAKLNDIAVIVFKRKVGETGALYGSVTSADIAEAIQAKGVDIDRRQVRLSDPIKRPGTTRVVIHVHDDLNAEVAIDVESDEAEA